MARFYIATVYLKAIDTGRIFEIKYFWVLRYTGILGRGEFNNTSSFAPLRQYPLCLGTRPASRTRLQFVPVKYTAGAATFSENVTIQVTLPINGFRLLCDRMGKFSVAHWLSERVNSMFL